MRWMRQGLLALAASTALLVHAPSPARAIEYPWCAVLGGTMDGARNCGFVSFQQCLGYIQGLGGFCEQNQFYTAPKRQSDGKPRKRQHD
jgi:Protein of unknown function (DUF3551)